MIDQIKSMISSIKNPNTGKTLAEEGRIETIRENETKVYISYKRDGITVEQKRQIEEEFIAVLKDTVEEGNLYIKTTSTESEVKPTPQNQTAPPSAAQAANLKVGHEQQTGKKRVIGVKHVIAVGSGKGGVGKSTFSSNLAVSLKNAGKKVGLIDGDIYGPSVPMLFNVRKSRPSSNSNKKIVPLESAGIKLMSFGLFIEEEDPVIWRGPMLGGVLNQFLFDVDWGELDYLIIDLPPGTGDIQLSMVQNVEVDGSVIISTPQDVALLDAIKALKMFEKLKVPVVGLVENMSSFICDSCGTEHFIFGNGGVEKKSADLSLKHLGDIPLEMNLRLCADEGTPYMAKAEHEKSKVWNAYTDIAQKVDNHFNNENNKKEEKGILGKLFNRT